MEETETTGFEVVSEPPSEQAPQAQPKDSAVSLRGQAEEIVFPEADATLVRTVHTGDAIEHGGLARSIGTDYREDLPIFHLEVHPGQGLDSPEADRQTVNF